jgi:hypothetical protein
VEGQTTRGATDGCRYCTGCGKELLNPTDEQIEKGVQDFIEWKRKQDPDWK